MNVSFPCMDQKNLSTLSCLQGGFSNFPARTAARAPTSVERNSSPSFAARPAVPAFRPSPTAPPHQPSVEPENTVLDYDYDSGLSRWANDKTNPLYTLYTHHDQVPAFQASSEGKTGCTRGREKEGAEKFGQSCQEEKDSSMRLSRNIEGKLNI